MLTPNQRDRAIVKQGLTSEQVELNRQKYGRNVLTPPKRDPWWVLFLEKFADPVIRILMIAAIIALVVGGFQGEYVEGLGIIMAIFLATTLAFINEYRANQAFAILNQYVDDVQVRVMRDGRFTTIPRKDLVVGDVVYVEQGEEIPADGELLETVSLLIDESKITGESETIQKMTRQDAEEQGVHEDTYPIFNVYRSTIVDQGNGLFAVSAVGDQTEIGQLATAVATVESGDETPLNQQLEKLSQLIGLVGLSFATLIFSALLLRGLLTRELLLTAPQGYFLGVLILSVVVFLTPVWGPVVSDGLGLIDESWELPPWLTEDGLKAWLKSLLLGLAVAGVGVAIGLLLDFLPTLKEGWLTTEVSSSLLQYFMVAVTIIVVAVPEGLPMSVTLSLAYSMKKMAASNNLVRRMHACETIGAATVICSDKTGTLTRNKMMIHEVNFPSLHSTKFTDLEFNRSLIAEAIAGNSTADLDLLADGQVEAIGNATEGALLLWLDHEKLDYMDYRRGFHIHFRMSFSAQNKWMATLGRSGVTRKDILHLKGAPEVILERCSHILTEYGVFPLHNKEPILAAITTYQKRGMRILSFAYQDLPDNLVEFDLENMGHYLNWLGFVAIEDPLRAEVPQAIQACRKAGIQVKVVTGDGAETAQEIARQIGLCEDESTWQMGCLTGPEFRQMPDEEARERVKSLKVLSRAVPLDKLRLVKLLQEQGEVVGVTGDGTNDAAALKQAKVGLAMGSGTAIAKEASDIILLDDSFQSIVNAIIWGRSLYENIQRFILFQLTINVVALGIALLGPFIGVSLPLTVTQMLWVNLIMDTFAALALATEPPHDSVLDYPPRPRDAFIISGKMGWNICISGVVFLIFLVGFLLYLQRDHLMTDYELSIFFAVFVMLQFWNLFNARCLGLKQSAFNKLNENWSFVAIATTILVGQVVIIQFGGEVFRTVPLSLEDWSWIIGGTSVILWIGEIWRFAQRLRESRDS
ncbi:calcium-translocating P-type ATPase, PMCA-type [Spirulina subsalsa FACHB-351]|uniref:P-type Ca(2+) transporter n=1 Tax=Spirulina subsalsa FACHB-351 TaxID=234711 RepID=A0ABT3L4F5_9CYAN|nr:calcium-translocating P-type ATPase, PMCA-type [Spirulina subsalsa]MCW6036388.1 calcium-translocating P-type ATPase, PMCA-type [Spirulina subsalsa FACHB-351]